MGIAAPKSYYVTKSGADRNTGTNLTSAWITIQKAASSATPGSTVYIGPGIYYETVTINVQGNTKDGPITFTSLSRSARAIISGKYARAASVDGSLNLIYVDKKSHLRFIDLELTELNATECSGVRVVGGGTHVGMYHTSQMWAKPAESKRCRRYRTSKSAHSSHQRRRRVGWSHGYHRLQ